MKYIFIEPITYGFSYSPITGIPSLIGILESNSYEAEHINLNNEIINNCFDEIFYSSIIKNRNYSLFKQNYSDAPEIIKNVINTEKKLLEKRNKFNHFNKQRIVLAKTIFKTKKFFLDRILYEFAYKSICELPTEICFLDNIFEQKLLPDIGVYRSFSEKENFSIDIDSIKYYFENNISPINDFLDKRIDEILSKKPSCIGITISFPFSFVTGMLIAYKIKQKSDTHINIGGSFFNDFYEKIDNLEDFFGTFFDTISINDNSSTVIDLMKYINNEIDIENVSNIIYAENGMLKKSKSEKYIKLKDFPFQSFNGYSFRDHISPDLILPIKASSTCYWRKCIFCMYSTIKEYQTRPVSKVVDEMEFLSRKYNTKYFIFWDNSLHPTFLSKLADLILKRNLNFRFSIYARFEKDFNYKLFKKLKKAGCIKIHWGLDSANQRVLNYIKKGIDLDSTSRILKEAKKAGIYNFVYLIIGHPTETHDEINSIYEFIEKNKKTINRLDISPHVLFCTNSIISKDREKYRKLIKTTPQERIELKQQIMKYFNNVANQDYCSNSEKDEAVIPMLLYVDKYGSGIKSMLFSSIYQTIKSNKKLLNFYLKYKLNKVKNYKEKHVKLI